jgi:DNA-binding beta-propeller fold protein YncE
MVNNSGTGVTYEYTPYDQRGNLLKNETKTSASTTSTCMQLEEALHAGRPISPSLAGHAEATAGAPQEFLLDQASLSVQVLDLSTFNLAEADLPGGGNTQYPTGMDITPDGATIWVTQLAIGQNNAGITPKPPLVSTMNVAQQAFTGSFTLPNNVSPHSIRFSPDGTSAYITNDGSPAEGVSGVPANSSVLVLNRATQTVTKTIPTPKGAGDAAESPDGLLLYTIGNNSGLGSNNLTVIDTTTNTVATSVALPDGAVKIFVNPTGTRLYVLWLRGIDVFDTATLQQVAAIPAQNSALTNFAYFTPDGATAFICGCGYGVTYQLDVGTNQVINTIQSQAHGFQFGAP